VTELVWRKSSFSGVQTACVEVAWRKSSFSGVQTDCVELAWPGAGMAVRDSKNADGPTLSFGRTEFAEFIAALQAHES